MNPGGGPDRDDTGLPPVDIEIPDDARELDRDVQAYRRELRAQRRRGRSTRVHGMLARDSMVMPLLICCLVVALITGTLLTIFTSTAIGPAGLPGAAKHGGSASPGAATTPAGPAATSAPGLASALVEVAGHRHAVSALGPAILLVAPAGCRCDSVLAQVAGLAAQAHEATYLVAAPAELRQSARLAGRLGHGLMAASDVSGILAGGSYPHAGLTAILVSPSGTVSYEQRLQAGADLHGLIDSV